jgi:GntR family transcriptional regulator
MLYLQIDARSQIPVYEQIMDRIRGLIRERKLVACTPLPSVRQLAADLELNPNTVAKAYGILEREGLLETARRRGTIVAPSAADRAEKSVALRVDEGVDRLIEETANLGVDLKELVSAFKRRVRVRARANSGTPRRST